MDSFTPAPADDPRYLEVNGHRLLRVMGGDGSEEVTTEKPATEPVQAPEPEATPDPFDEKFDPASLPEELRAGWNQLRGDYTRKTQELAEQRKETEAIVEFAAALQNPQTRADALRQLGLDIEVEEEGDPSALLEDPTEERIAALEQALTTKAQQEQQAEYQRMETQYIDTQLDELEGRTGRQFSDEELNTLEAMARALPDEHGLPNIGNAYTHLYEGVWPKVLEQYTETKRNAVLAPQGQSGSQKIDLSDPEVRARHMAEIAQAHGA